MTHVTRPYALWIGVLAPHKAPLEVVEIANRIPEMDFIMVGSPWNKDILQRLRSTKPQNLQYLGVVSDSTKRQLIQGSSVGLTTSKYEGFGWVPFEFLTEGKPVLGYPLKPFREIYGDLLIYANNVSELVTRLKQLYSNDFRITINKDAIRALKRKYDLDRAAARIVKRLNSRSLVVFTSDVSENSSSIAGYLLINWKLCKGIRDTGTDLEIISWGTRFSRQFHLETHTMKIQDTITLLRERVATMETATGVLGTLRRKALRLVLLLIEPLCFVNVYLRKSNQLRAGYVIATGQSQFLGAVILKLIFYRLKIAFLLHDTRAYRFTPGMPFFFRSYNLIFLRSLRYADQILAVSNSALKEVLEFCPFPERATTIWQNP
jgi:hypothetical protein